MQDNHDIDAPDASKAFEQAASAKREPAKEDGRLRLWLRERLRHLSDVRAALMGPQHDVARRETEARVKHAARVARLSRAVEAGEARRGEPTKEFNYRAADDPDRLNKLERHYDAEPPGLGTSPPEQGPSPSEVAERVKGFEASIKRTFNSASRGRDDPGLHNGR